MTLQNLVQGSNLGPEFEQGTNVPGSLTINVDGTTVVRDATTGELSSPVTTLNYDNTTGILTYVNEAGTPQTINLGALASDIFVDGASFDASTSILTLTDNDAGTPDITVDLSSFLGVSSDAGNLLVDGTDGKPFLDSGTVCTDIKANCFQDCPVTDIFGNLIGTVQEAI